MSNDIKVIMNIHHEMLCDDAYAAADFFQDVFGAKRVEVDFADKIEEDFELKNRHMELNGKIYQFITPNDEVSEKLKNWYDRSVLPGIHNVTLMVSDAEALALKLRELGCVSMGEMHSVAPDCKTPCTVYMYDCTKQCGLRIEFIQAPPDMTEPIPSNPVSGDEDSMVVANVHTEILCDDPIKAAAFFEEVFGAQRVEENFARKIEEGFELENRHMILNGDVYQFIKPDPEDEVKWELENWYDRSVMPGIHNVTFAVKDAEGLARTLREHGVRSMGEMHSVAPDCETPCKVYMYDATKQCGMRFEFIQA